MTNTTLNATVAKVPFGSIELEGLLLENGEFAIAIPQIVTLDLVPPNRSQKQIEALLGIVFQSHQKAKTSLNPKAVNIISLLDFGRILAKLDRSGNKTAQIMRDCLVDVSLHQLFCDAFDIKFEKAERQEWLKARMSGKETRRTLTDSIKDWLDRHIDVSQNTKNFIYINCSEAINKSLFGLPAKKLIVARGFNESTPTRDCLIAKELKQLDHVEGFAIKLIDKQDIYPLEAVKDALEFYS